MIVILTGPVHSGKTSFLKKIHRRWRKKIPLAGYLSPAHFENNIHTGYDLLELESGALHPFIRNKGKKEWERVGSWYFLPGKIELAKKIIFNSKPQFPLIVDEIGPLEMQGNGVRPAVEKILTSSSERFFLFVARDFILNEVSELVGHLLLQKPHVFDIRDTKQLQELEAIISNESE